MGSRALVREESNRLTDCLECDRLATEIAALLYEYNAAIDALAATSRKDPLYQQRWAGLSSASDRLCAAQQVEIIHHQESHDS
jgi:hypothetical protein